MARTYKQPSIVSGMTVNDILNMDEEAFNKLNLGDLRKVVGRLVSAGNKRLRTFEKYGEKSPAERYINKRSGGKFSTKGKNLAQLRSEFMRAKGFLTAKTGTVKQWRKIKQKEINELNRMGIPMDNDTYDLVWQTYNKLKEQDKSVTEKKFRYEVLKEITKRILKSKGKPTPETISRNIKKDLTKIYEKMKENEKETDGTSSFFEKESEDLPF